ncbi:MAG: tRNA uridine-5-carboxymethylaminomethyl(34) synthesis GTPase MnmE [Candidatus Omnitrophica bacterium]|nr:tRNA uridine-5-carboxymethylaminomethyl(34) synthesis GTPase MnmE [Candidatus Omnitrophota bacterium]
MSLLADDWDTIVAVATAKGEAPIAVVRMSGREAIAIADQVFRARSVKRLAQAPSATVHYGRIVEENGAPGGGVLDEVLVTVFRAPRSYTREDMVEVSCHGGPFVQERIARLLQRRGARPSAPGEFTKRAFLNGRMDLAQAEAVLDLIRARGDAALKNAAEQLEGSLSRTIQNLRSELLDLLAHLEVAVDFPDEEVEILDRGAMLERLTSLGVQIESLLRGASMGRFLREGIRTVIAGRPNVGKSSLLNRLVGVDRAIVTDVPGTTRDAIEEEVELNGMRFRLVDTAGYTETEDRVERIGVARARQWILNSDLTIFVVDGSEPLQEEDRRVAELLSPGRVIPVINKCDLGTVVSRGELKALLGGAPEVKVSAREGTGMGELEQALVQKAAREGPEAPEGSWVTNLRHRDCLERSQAALKQSLKTLGAHEPPEFVSADVREALEALGEIVGEVTTDDLLDQIFSQFCIGK